MWREAPACRGDLVPTMAPVVLRKLEVLALDVGYELRPHDAVEIKGRLAGVLGVPHQDAVALLGDLDAGAIGAKGAPTPFRGLVTCF